MVEPLQHAPPEVALAALRGRRRAARSASIDRFDAFYQAYLTAFLATVGVLVVSGAVGDGQASSEAVDRILHVGPAWLGLGVAGSVAVGLRSGSRGGPLALEPADVHHVLLAPLRIADALRGPAVRQLRTLTFGAAAVGAVSAQLALRRLPGNALVWLLAGSAFTMVAVGFGIGAGWLAAGHRLDRRAATFFGGALVGWSVLDAIRGWATSPSTILGRLPLWPLRFQPTAVLPVLLLVALLPAGLRALDGLSLEAAQRRSALVGQLRFAATMRDVRTVILLRRQLNQEAPRARPWLPGRHGERSSSVTRRGYRALMRTPASRLVRMLALCATAALAAAGAWSGTTPLLVVAGLASYLAGLEAVEPLAQEIDHPTVLELSPIERGRVLSAHLVVPVLTMTILGGLTAVGVALLGAGPTARSLAVVTIVPAALAGVAGAAITTVSGAFAGSPEAAMVVPPEAAGMGLLYRAAFPPAVAAAGFLPVLHALHARDTGLDPVEAARAGVGPAVVLAGLVFGYVRIRPRLAAATSSLATPSAEPSTPTGGT